MLDSGDDQSEPTTARIAPSLRMTFPSPGGCVSGDVVVFIGEVNLGAELAARLVTKPRIQARAKQDTAGLTAKQRRFARQFGSNSGDGDGGGKESLPDIDRCVVRVVVDGAVASTILVDAAASADDNSHSAEVIKTAVTPPYEQNARCTEQPAKAETVAAAADGRTWGDDEAIWRLETRAIDRICTREVFDVHRIFGELARRSSNSGGPVTEYGST